MTCGGRSQTAKRSIFRRRPFSRRRPATWARKKRCSHASRMAETIIDRAVCESCGADVRDGTTFCYNCGKSVNAEASEPPEAVHTSNGSSTSTEAQAALDDLAQRMGVDETSTVENKRAEAAAE